MLLLTSNGLSSSAGALVLSPTLELIDQYTPRMNFLNLEDLRGLNLSTLHILPHYSQFLTRFEGFEETCRRFEATVGRSVVRLEDGQGLEVTADGFRLIYRTAHLQMGGPVPSQNSVVGSVYTNPCASATALNVKCPL